MEITDIKRLDDKAELLVSNDMYALILAINKLTQAINKLAEN